VPRKGIRQRLSGGDEWDVITSWRRVISWGRGEVARIKRKMRRRERHEAKKRMEEG
jgi:hypothetical protein